MLCVHLLALKGIWGYQTCRQGLEDIKLVDGWALDFKQINGNWLEWLASSHFFIRTTAQRSPYSPHLLSFLPSLFFCLSRCFYFVSLSFLSPFLPFAHKRTQPNAHTQTQFLYAYESLFCLQIVLVLPSVRPSSSNASACLICECHSREICTSISRNSMCLIPKYNQQWKEIQ